MPHVAALPTRTVSSLSARKDTHCSNGKVEVRCVNGDRQQNGSELVVHSRRSSTAMKQDINQNLRLVDGAKSSVPQMDTKSRLQVETENTWRLLSESPSTGKHLRKSKTRRSRNRSLASRDERLTNGGAERHENQNGGRKWSRSRTLSPAVIERLDYHVSRPMQTEPEVARRESTDVGFESSSAAVAFRHVVYRNCRGVASAPSDVGAGKTVSSLPDKSHRSVLRSLCR